MCPRVVVVAFSAKPVSLALCQLCNGKLVELEAFFFLALRIGEIAVTPIDGPLVIVVDTRKDSGFTNVILGLGYVVEAGIVHNGRRMTVFFDPRLVAQTVDGRCPRCPLVVSESEGMANLVRTYKAYELPHQLIIKLRLAGTGVNHACLSLVPIV